MKVLTTIAEMRAFARSVRRSDQKIALVPTMGALHEGHLTLVREAANHAEVVVVSIFVNRTQFGPKEDLSAYPRTLDEDCKRLSEEGLTSAVFAPSSEEMYPDGDSMTWVAVERLTEHLCGTSRPGHFRGVATVVTKLFTICLPHVAVFGLKDAQQFFVIRRLTADLNLDVEVMGVPTVRELDGLALSSRNKYLSKEERAQATILFRAVSAARKEIESGETDGTAVTRRMETQLDEADAGAVDYAQLVNAADFQPVQSLSAGMTVVAAVAVQFGNARLIDNAIVDVP